MRKVLPNLNCIRDEEKTVCGTRYVSYEFLVMPFGLTMHPSHFALS
jgi:hypothetical protein